ncbi:MAG: hypothetical protein AB1757_18415 [Acidobacteriota bacterium]
MRPSFSKRLLHFAFASVLLIQTTAFKISAQNDEQPAKCDESRAFWLIDQQLDEAKKIEAVNKKIAVMIRAADLLWKAREAQARKVFAEAFDLAEQHFKDKGDESIRDGRSLTLLPDQRFVVMQAIARRDGAWAKQLAVRVAEETRKQAEAAASEAKSRNSYQQKFEDKLLQMAIDTAKSDPQTAATFVRNTFSYPLTSSIGPALYAILEVNQPLADQLYQDAVRNYANAPINEFLFLTAYPFLRDRNIGTEIYMNGFGKPKSETANPAMQQLFIESLLARAEATLRLPEQPISGAYKLPEVSQLIFALDHLEGIAAEYQPAYVNRIIELKSFLNGALTPEMRQALGQVQNQHKDIALRMQPNSDAFTKYSEKAEREADPDKREMAMAFAVLNASNDISLDTIISLIRKIDDEKLRQQLFAFTYFKRSQKAVKDGDFFLASQLAKNVEQLDLRAYLSYEIAAAALKKAEEKPRARDALDEVLTLAYKAPNTNEKARTLLGVVFLYVKIEPLRAFEVMTEAVKTINSLDNPNFSTAYVQQKIEGKQFSSYYGYGVEGFDLEKVFRLLAPLDFDGGLYRARSLDDRSQRALGILALAAVCLEEVEKSKKQQENLKKKSEPAEKPISKKTKTARAT